MINQQKIKEWVDIYLQHIEEVSVETHVRDEEGYKFKTVNHFLQNFSIDAPNLAENLDLSIEKTNLVVGNMYFPRGMLIEFAQGYEDKTREILKILFDLDLDIVDRVNNTESSFNDLLEIWKKDNEGKEEANSFISLRFISLLLGMRYPEKYNAIKPREWNLFSKFINDEYKNPIKVSSGKKYQILNEHIEALRVYVKEIPEIKLIKDQLTRGLEFTDEEYRWITQDIIYVTARNIASEKGKDENTETMIETFDETEVENNHENQKMEFPLEQYLENFIIKNWNNIDFGEKLNMYYDEDGSPAQQYPTTKGYIDILAKDTKNNLVVIELKKGRSNEHVVGQILAYIGWVKNNLAGPNQKVRGIIVASDANTQLHDAVSMVEDLITVKYYRVDFSFENPNKSV
jgi:hypothetical protein